MTRLLILHTGGTIGMRPSPTGYVPADGFPDRLAHHLAASLNTQPGDPGRAVLPDYHLIELAPLIDSADLAPVDWNRIVAALAEHWHGYDGFIVLHGTDTLAYTASALSFMLGALDKPVVLTGAQIPLGEPRSDAINNLTTALLMAADPAAPREVCIAFHDRLLRGNRARKVRSQGFDAFDSPDAPWLGEAGIALSFTPGLAMAPGQPEADSRATGDSAAAFTPDVTPRHFAPGAVAMLPVHPGLSAAMLDAVLGDPALKGLVLQTYGVGNPPSLDGALIERLAQASQAGIAILNISQCQQGQVVQGAYASGAALNAAGVIPGADLTPEAALTKLQVLIADGLEGRALRAALATPLRGEMSPG